MKFILLILLSFSLVFSYENAVEIVHKNYTTVFDTVKHYPIMVTWWLTKEKISCYKDDIVRRNGFRFSPDPFLYNYTNLYNYYNHSGYDKGHNFNASSGRCDSITMMESFYFSNMTPQHPKLNRKIWEELERYTDKLVFKYDSIKVVCGSYGCVKKIGIICVPSNCWKILYVKKLNKYKIYNFTNDSLAELKNITIEELESLTNVKLK